MKDDRRNKDSEYVWHFKLSLPKRHKNPGSDKILEMVRSQIQNLLDIVVLTQDGRELKPNGFRFLNGENEHRIF